MNDNDLLQAQIRQLLSNQAMQQQRMANAPDSLLDALASYGLLDDEQAMQMLNYKAGHEGANTAMPQGMTVRNQYIAPSPFQVVAATMQQAMGSQKQNAALAQMQANLLRKGNYNRQIGEYERDFYRQQAAAEAAKQAQPQAATPDPAVAADPVGGGRGFVVPPAAVPPRRPALGLRPTGKVDSLGNPIFVDENGDPQGGPMHNLSGR